MERMQSYIKDLERASLEAASQSLVPRGSNRHSMSHQAFQEQLNNSLQNLSDMIDPVQRAGCSQAEKLGHLVTMMADYVQPLASAAIACASQSVKSRMQMDLLDQSRTVAECSHQLVFAAKEGGGNHKVRRIY